LKILLAALLACNPDPGEIEEGVGYRDQQEVGATSGERGSVRISEVFWSGSVKDDGTWDPEDIFVEVRNEGSQPLNLSGWRLQVEGALEETFRFPESDRVVYTGEHVFAAASNAGCFPDPDYLIADLELPNGDPFEITLLDFDERLIDSAGNETMPPFAGGYDLVTSRSMEKIELMFGGEGSQPSSWHFYSEQPDLATGVDRIADGCHAHTLASPGHANSADYSGAYASGSLD
jgi:hypothetical protein